MVVCECILIVLLVCTVFLLVCMYLSDLFLWCEKITCFVVDPVTYSQYQDVIRYNKRSNRSIPVYSVITPYSADNPDMRGYYIVKHSLYFRDDLTRMSAYKLMMNDLIKRNSLEYN